MNRKSEQLTAEYNIAVDYDQPLSPITMSEVIKECLGDKCSITKIHNRKVITYENKEGKRIALLCKSITYLGNPHPIFKKRIQIPSEWIALAHELENDGYDVRFIGVYHYNGFIVFADFVKDTYLKRNCHNSAAHIYINDIYQGATQGVFEKEDQNGNVIRAISRHSLADYFDSAEKGTTNLARLFAQFNNEFIFGEWIEATKSIHEMMEKGWSQWKQLEWAGWFLEYKFHNFAKNEEIAPYIVYTALSNKGHKKDRLDLDLWFPNDNFYGDLKASDRKTSKAPGNDQETVIKCLNKYGKMWYVVYEHETIKDSEKGYEATKYRGSLLGKGDSMSYAGKMKHSVKFTKMYIIEINRINFHEVLSAFNQGHQPNGAPRKPKFNINKRNVDNYVVYRYAPSPKAKFRFIDLFCGIGGFHQAMSSFGGECVFASEIDKDCIDAYFNNYGLDAAHDITKVDEKSVPPHDVLCAGFPCQAFSKAGKQAGVNDTRGTLFFEIERILRHHKPPFIILENVRNLVSHDNGRTWKIITGVLKDIGYRLTAEPLILSPHQFGVPQLRERVYIVGKYEPEKISEPLDISFNDLKDKNDLSIYDILEKEPVSEQSQITADELKVLSAWDEFYKGIDLKVIGFPVNTSYFNYSGDISSLPQWKQSHILRNQKLYRDNKAFIDSWLKKWNNLADFTPTQRKFEWQCGTKVDSVFDALIQMRPSGIRVKTPTIFPALVAMVQIPVIGKYKRRLTPRECARLQSFPDSFKICPNRFQALKQFGNSVNVRVLQAIFKQLMEKYGPIETKSCVHAKPNDSQP